MWELAEPWLGASPSHFGDEVMVPAAECWAPRGSGGVAGDVTQIPQSVL